VTAHPNEHDAWRLWRDAAARDDVDGAIRAIYDRLDEDIAARGPVCELSGRCCRFESFEHRLYVTGLEIAWFTARLDEASIARWCEADLPGLDGCPFQVAGRCSTHAIRPLGCRVFFCDPSAQAWQQPVTEHFLRALRELHDAHGLPYRYMEWRAGLDAARQVL